MEKKTEVPKNRRVAVIGYIEVDGGEYRDRLVAQSLSEWKWVTEEEYKLLIYGSSYWGGSDMRYSIVECPIQEDVMSKMLIVAKTKKEAQEKVEAKRKKLAEDRKKKKKINKLQQFEKLKKELGK